ncbi:histidine kinase [Bacteroides sp. CR5/BHMF/2]|nr:histidine kinase [Bacteroides sp. CR5/BHMF/2]
MQIDPHFIFNNLSILLDLVETGDATAPIYIKCLSKVYRHIVANVDKNLSSVADELSSLEAYIFLLKIRFEDAIQVEVQVQDAIRERQIPPIVLQMLLENAIKHNQVSEETPLFIRVYSDGNKLVVENNCKPLTPNSSTHHIGLRNIKERYQLTGAPALKSIRMNTSIVSPFQRFKRNDKFHESSDYRRRKPQCRTPATLHLCTAP